MILARRLSYSATDIYINFFNISGARCNQTALTEAVNQIGAIVTQIQAWLTTIETAKTNLRKTIDCKHNQGIRSDVFAVYEGLYRRKVILNNVMTDLQTKKMILEKEQHRCQARCKCVIKKVCLLCVKFELKIT